MEGHDNSSSLFAQALNATRRGNLPKLERLCEDGLSVDEKDHNDETLLIKAAFWGQLQIVKFLLDRGASLDVVDRRLQQTALIKGARIGQKRIVEFLISKGASLDKRDHQNHTALMKAAASEHPDCVKLLVQGGASVDVQDGSGFTALMKAAYVGNLAIVRTLEERGASLDLEDCNGNTALKIAARKGHLKGLRYLLEKGARISRAGDEPIKVALHWNRGENPRRLARDLKCIQTLVRAGADINAACNKGNTVFHLAATTGFLECVNYLLGLPDLNRNATNDYGETALMLAAKTPSVGVVEACVRGAEVKVNVNMVDLQGYTAIMHAARCNQPACVTVLVENGADPNVVDRLRWTPLMRMAGCGHVDCVRALVSLGAEVDSRNAGGQTALDIANGKGRGDVVEFLEQQ